MNNDRRPDSLVKAIAARKKYWDQIREQGYLLATRRLPSGQLGTFSLNLVSNLLDQQRQDHLRDEWGQDQIEKNDGEDQPD